jgi:hypothetical protein
MVQTGTATALVSGIDVMLALQGRKIQEMWVKESSIRF